MAEKKESRIVEEWLLAEVVPHSTAWQTDKSD